MFGSPSGAELDRALHRPAGPQDPGADAPIQRTRGRIPGARTHPDLGAPVGYSGRAVWPTINLVPETLVGVSSRHVITITPAKEGSSDLNVERCRTSAFGTSSRNSPSTTSVLEEDLRVPVSPGASIRASAETTACARFRRLRRLLSPRRNSQLWTDPVREELETCGQEARRVGWMNGRIALQLPLSGCSIPPRLARLPQRKAGSTFPADALNIQTPPRRRRLPVPG